MAERYLTIARQLRHAIAQGQYGPGTALPSRLVLAKMFSTTRGTIDRTIRFLVEQGVVQSRHGAGTFVADTQGTTRVAVVGASGEALTHPELSIAHFNYKGMANKSNRDQLNQFDGVVWHLPPSQVRNWMTELPSNIPQIILNRDFPECNFITFDHQGIYESITTERLKLFSDGEVYFVRPIYEAQVIDIRLKGFLAACSQANRDYKIISLPEDFESALNTLERQMPKTVNKPIIIVGAYLGGTGAVMTWIRAKGLKWGKDVLYSDMDNEYPAHVWGIKVTSFIQDYPRLLDLSLQNIYGLCNKDIERVQLRIPAMRNSGKT